MSDQQVIFIATGLGIAFFMMSFVWYLENKQKEAYRKRARMIRYLRIFQNLVFACDKGFKDRKLLLDRLKFSLSMHFSTDDFEAITKLLTDDFFSNLSIDDKELHRFIFKTSKNSLMQTYQNLLAWTSDPDNQRQIHITIAWYRKQAKPKIKKLKHAEKKVTKINLRLDKPYQFTAKPPIMKLDTSIKNLEEQLNKWISFFQDIKRSDQMPISFLGDQPKEPGIPFNILGDLNVLLAALSKAQEPYEQKIAQKKDKKQKKIRVKEENKQAKIRKKEEQDKEEQEQEQPKKKNKKKSTSSAKKADQAKKESNEQKSDLKNQEEDKPSVSREERIAALGIGEPNQ